MILNDFQASLRQHWVIYDECSTFVSNSCLQLSLSLSHSLATYVTQPIIRSRFSTANYMSHCRWERERAIEWRVQIDRRATLSLSLSISLYDHHFIKSHFHYYNRQEECGCGGVVSMGNPWKHLKSLSSWQLRFTPSICFAVVTYHWGKLKNIRISFIVFAFIL